MEDRQTTQITIPNTAELCEVVQRGYYPELTDYALLTGAARVDAVVKDGRIHNYGKVWVRDLEPAAPQKAMALSFRANHQGKLAPENPRRNDVAVMPRILHPEALGFGVTELDAGDSVLTLEGRVAYYPHEHSNAVLSRQLAPFVRGGYDLSRNREQVVGHYNGPLDPALAHANHDQHCRYDCYHYDGGNYLYLPAATKTDKLFAPEMADGTRCEINRDYFVSCEPIRALRCADGSIQIAEPLLTHPLHDGYWQPTRTPEGELDLTKQALSDYLNYQFIKDLRRSTQFINQKVAAKLSHMKGIFPPTSLVNDYIHGCRVSHPEIER